MSGGKRPLEDILVVDLSRMLPGAVLARQLLDLGARLVKVEDPEGGDPMRQVPPLVGGVGLGFAAFMRGAESVTLDLRDVEGAAILRRLASRADVVVESFRPGRLEQWGLGADRLCIDNPRLVWCSLSSWGRSGEGRGRVGHDLNFISELGAATQMSEGGVPRIQLADVSAGLLAATTIVAALLSREKNGEGMVVDQPLAAGPLPFLTWSMAEAAAGAPAVLDILLGGACPSYRRYACADEAEVAVAALEPKFWVGLVEVLGLPHLAGSGLATGDEGERVAGEVAAAFAGMPRAHWLRLAAERSLPVSTVRCVAEANASGVVEAAGLAEDLPLPGGGAVTAVGPYLPSIGRTPARPAPRLGEHTEAVLEEIG